MKEIIVSQNESGQRIDRFLRKYLDKAPRNFIYRMIRRKNIELNNSRTRPNAIISTGDTIQLYLADETIRKFRSRRDYDTPRVDLDIIYEDNNIILINKKSGTLSHGAGEDKTGNLVDSMIQYLIDKKDFEPDKEKTFTPSICNRLDRNTSGIIIGAKNYESLRTINQALRHSKIERFYKTIVKGQLKEEIKAKGYLEKNREKNLVKITEDEGVGAKKILTNIRPLQVSNNYSLLEVELITGRPHQIRSHLAHLGYPIIGDRKYGDKHTNQDLLERFGLKDQWLHGYKIKFDGLERSLDYLNGKIFKAEAHKGYTKIEQKLFSK
ncbi:MAG TPA: RluA family pseudouridine synthase [Tissierellaceae bacterium]|nr:RluA family pseudouridine synthase [Tissierellaceae bacterium]